MSDTAPTEMPSESKLLFDADAEQRVELTLRRTDNGGKVKKNRVAHIFRPMTDEEFFQYEQKKSIVQKISGTNIVNVRTQDKNLQAAEWLWNEVAVGRTGYVERSDWREKTDLLDKHTAIKDGLLAVFPATDSNTDIFDDSTLDAEMLVEDDDEFSDELVDEDAQTIVRLDCLFNSQAITTTHYFAAPSAKDVTDYENFMKKASNMMDGRKGWRQKKANQTSQISIPSKARELCGLYDRLIIKPEGYVGRVPAHHKREAVLEIFTREADVNEGNEGN